MTESAFTRARLLKRLPLMALILVPAFGYFMLFGPKPAADHDVVFKFPKPLESVRRVTATWTDPHDDNTALAGSTFDTSKDASVRELRARVHVPDGEAVVHVEIDAPGGVRTMRRKVQLGAGQTTILLQDFLEQDLGVPSP